MESGTPTKAGFDFDAFKAKKVAAGTWQGGPDADPKYKKPFDPNMKPSAFTTPVKPGSVMPVKPGSTPPTNMSR